MRLNCGEGNGVHLQKNVAKYRPHRPHPHQCGDLQDFLAVDTIALYYRPQRTITDRSRKYRPPIDRLEM